MNAVHKEERNQRNSSVNKPVDEGILDHYQQAGPDYKSWSSKKHMHFGYYSPGSNPFNREGMLDQMVLEVFKELGLANCNSKKSAMILDAGCGIGASLRMGAKTYPRHHWLGVTIVPEQIDECSELNRKAGLTEISLRCEDLCHNSIASNSIDYIYAIESVCHTEGANKEHFLREAYRILKPGGKLVIADVFRKAAEEEIDPISRHCYKQLCRGWAVPGLAKLDEFISEASTLGFTQSAQRDISWNVAPCATHVPYVSAKFLLAKLLAGEKLNRVRLAHVKSSMMTIVLGLNRKRFSYYILSLEKPGRNS